LPRAATLADFMRTCLVMSVILYFPIFAVYVTAIFPQFTKIGPHAPAQWSDPSPFLGPCPSLTFDSRQAPPGATPPRSTSRWSPTFLRAPPRGADETVGG